MGSKINSCRDCGYRKNKFILCSSCNSFLCVQCVKKGMCNDCFTLVEVKHYTSDYKYVEMGYQTL